MKINLKKYENKIIIIHISPIYHQNHTNIHNCTVTITISFTLATTTTHHKYLPLTITIITIITLLQPSSKYYATWRTFPSRNLQYSPPPLFSFTFVSNALMQQCWITVDDWNSLPRDEGHFVSR